MRLPIVHVDEAFIKSLSNVYHTPKVVEQSKKYIALTVYLRVFLNLVSSISARRRDAAPLIIYHHLCVAMYRCGSLQLYRF